MGSIVRLGVPEYFGIPVEGVTMGVRDYRDDFDTKVESLSAGHILKVERRQNFEEPDQPSWQRYAVGDWPGALREIDAMRPGIEAHYAALAERDIETRRVRIVERPLSSYLLWELHVLKLRDELGCRVNVLDAERLGQLEVSDQYPGNHVMLPEMVLVGHVVYGVQCSPSGMVQGATRYDSPELYEAARDLITELYFMGEPVQEYFTREVASLPPLEDS